LGRRWPAPAHSPLINSPKRRTPSLVNVREWLAAQAASGYVTYDADSKTFTLPPEQAMALAQEGSPVFVPGAFEVIRSVMLDQPKIAKRSSLAKGLAGTSTVRNSFGAPSAFSARATLRISPRSGFPRSKAWKKS
jgi:hypothetical protein